MPDTPRAIRIPDDLWRAVLRRQPARDLALLPLFPDDVTAN